MTNAPESQPGPDYGCRSAIGKGARRLRVGGGDGARSTVKAKAARRAVLAFSGSPYRHRNMIERRR